MPGKRRSYGVITGLAARKTTGIRKGISPMNRPPLSDKVGWWRLNAESDKLMFYFNKNVLFSYLWIEELSGKDNKLIYITTKYYY